MSKPISGFNSYTDLELIYDRPVFSPVHPHADLSCLELYPFFEMAVGNTEESHFVIGLTSNHFQGSLVGRLGLTSDAVGMPRFLLLAVRLLSSEMSKVDLAQRSEHSLLLQCPKRN
jgi:hypothetical protein